MFAAHQLADVRRRLCPASFIRPHRGADLAGRAVTALERVVIHERLLQRWSTPPSQSPSIFVRWRILMIASVKHELMRLPSTRTGARAALAVVTTLFGSGKAEAFAKASSRSSMERRRAAQAHVDRTT